MSASRQPALITAIEGLWAIPSPGPRNLMSAPEFTQLCDTCIVLYPNAGTIDRLRFALSDALRSLGLPCELMSSNAHLAMSAESAATQLDAAFKRTAGRRLFLCPLDMADHFPSLQFGPNTVREYSATELDTLVGSARLAWVNQDRTFDSQRFSRFRWLIVEESFELSEIISRRALSILDQVFLGDWGRIEPHRERFKRPVEDALFAILLAPWEDWVDSPSIDWLGFRVPWAYEFTDDIFTRPPPPPSSDTLSCPDFFIDQDGEVVDEGERPIQLSFNSSVSEAIGWLNDDTWTALTDARRSPLFETPIAHFFVRAFCAEGIDEFLAHITTIEAALGLRSDYDQGGATRRMGTRVSALLGTPEDGDAYKHLFDLRSRYLHGRAMDDITGQDRLLARRLARRVVNEIVRAAFELPASRSRAEYLTSLG